MAADLRIMRNGHRVPVVAFFGTKGGVGKTTIAREFAELVTGAKVAPNVLIVDVDVHNRGMTVDLTKQTPISCKTVHDYIASKNVSDVEAVDMTHTIEGSQSSSGRLFFIPSSTPEAGHVFDESAKIGPQKLLEILFGVVKSAVETYECDCVVIDCGPIIDPYTAAGATLADREFLIGQNEPISFSNLKFYPNRIREFYSDFSTTKMKLIINKVRGWERLRERELQEDVFHAIPFTMDIVDVSEGLAASDEMKMLMFKDHIAQIVEKVFKPDHPELIPSRKSILPQRWESLMANVDRLEKAPPIRRLGLMRLALPVGLLALAVGGFLFYAGSTERHRLQNRAWASEVVSALEKAIAAAQAAGQAMAAQLQEALTKVKEADPVDANALEQAIAFAEEKGLREAPTIKHLDTTNENIGIGVALGGLLVVSIGVSCCQSRRRYLTALQTIRKDGAKGIMDRLSNRSARKTFDKLLKMADALPHS
ncbi:MAG: AAA family ATPase [Planctomycetota bacterium]|nr:AAA family ATPase [Planctomycetota bacterium]